MQIIGHITTVIGMLIIVSPHIVLEYLIVKNAYEKAINENMKRKAFSFSSKSINLKYDSVYIVFVKKQTTIIISDELKKRLLNLIHTKEDETNSRWSYAEVITFLMDEYARH